MRKLAIGLSLTMWVALLVSGCESGTRIKAVQPNFGNVAGNDDVAILGSGFKPGMLVHFGKHEAKNIVIDSAERLTVKTPAGAEGKVDVTITRDDGRTFVVREGFLYRKDAPSAR